MCGVCVLGQNEVEIHEFCILKVLQRNRCCAYENVDVISNRCAIQPAPYPVELVGFYGYPLESLLLVFVWEITNGSLKFGAHFCKNLQFDEIIVLRIEIFMMLINGIICTPHTTYYLSTSVRYTHNIFREYLQLNWQSTTEWNFILRAQVYQYRCFHSTAAASFNRNQTGAMHRYHPPVWQAHG